jgi:polyphosphate kinase
MSDDQTTESDSNELPPARVEHGRDGAPPVPATDEINLADPGWYLNRELSALSFQKRVLAEAFDDRNPLFERIRFVEIVTRNIDEFCMKRIGGLKQQVAGTVTERSPDGRLPGEQLSLVLDTIDEMLTRQDEVYQTLVTEQLPAAGIEICEYDSLSESVQQALRAHVRSEVLPTLTPLTVTPDQPFPFVSNLSLSLGVRTRGTDGTVRFSRVKVPENQPRLVDLSTVAEEATAPDDDGSSSRFVFLEEVIGHNLDLLFPSVEILEWAAFRVTRNAEVRRNEEVAEGLIEMIEGLLRDRRFATIVRVEVAEGMSADLRAWIRTNLNLDSRELFERTAPLNLRSLGRIRDLDRPDLALEPWTPRPHPQFDGLDEDDDRDVFDVIRADDVLVHHPYQSFEDTVQRLIADAATDSDVAAIKIAIYRTSQDSKLIENLIAAARNGKEVAVMVELKARFDEENNLRWVRRLEEKGIHVAYGTVELKAHSKAAIIVRREADGIQLYSHIGTGNYHAETARSYVDLGLLTCDESIGQDLIQLFNSFTGHSEYAGYEKLLVAPTGLRTELVDMIRQEAAVAEAGGDGRIVAKMNALEDPDIVAELYRAAMAGVDIDLIVRDICRLRPGVEGVTDTVTVRSVVGRFLEHSRIFYFGGGGDPAYFIGSADWMDRNLSRRVEAVTPIEDPTLRAELDDILEYYLSDNRRAWELQSDGSYVQSRPEGTATHDVQASLMEWAKTIGETEDT